MRATSSLSGNARHSRTVHDHGSRRDVAVSARVGATPGVRDAGADGQDLPGLVAFVVSPVPPIEVLHVTAFDGAAPPLRPSDRPTGSTWLADLFGWFGGADVRALRESSSDRPFYSALGACAFFFSLLSAFLVMAAVAYVTHTKDLWSLWWILPLWTAIMSSLERLMLQVAGDRALALLIVVLPRLVVSLLIALFIGEMFALKAFEPEIQDVIAAQQFKELQGVGPGLDRIYEGRIRTANADAARLLSHERKVEQRIGREDLRARQAQAEEGMCGDRCIYFRGLAARDRDWLADLRARHAGRIGNDRDEVKRLTAQRAADAAERRRTITRRDGLAARKAALHKLQNQDSAVASQVWLLRLLLIALDLSAFMAKVARVVTVKNSAHDKNVAGRRAQESLLGEERLERSATERARIRDEQRAARRRNRWRFEAQEFARSGDEGFEPADAPGGVPIDGYSLTEFTDDMESWERRAVVVPGSLRIGGAIGLTLLVLTAATAVLTGAHGMVLAFLAALGAVALCAHTRGFHRAQAWALRPIFATFVGGLLLSLVVLALNL